MFNITGLDKLQRDLKNAWRALGSLDGNIATLKFSPDDPRSVDAAIRDMERSIDRKVAPYRGNAIVENLSAQMKASYRQQIKQMAADAKRKAS